MGRSAAPPSQCTNDTLKYLPETSTAFRGDYIGFWFTSIKMHSAQVNVNTCMRCQTNHAKPMAGMNTRDAYHRDMRLAAPDGTTIAITSG